MGPILLTGATGLVGSALQRHLKSESSPTRIHPLPRQRPASGGCWWEPQKERVHDLPQNLHSVVHLAGENIASGRWNKTRKNRIRDSRIIGTRALVRALGDLPARPAVLVMASGISFYGDQGETLLTESSPPGTGFLAQLSQDWEAEGAHAQEIGVRVVQLRLGVVLSPHGGALSTMRTPFKLGLGGPLGSGKQWFPWVHIEDVVRTICWAIQTPEASGAYNLVAPTQTRQRDFARCLGEALRRPAVLPAPAFALRVAFGDMADEAMLASHRASPARLQEQGFEFLWSDLDTALQTTAT